MTKKPHYEERYFKRFNDPGQNQREKKVISCCFPFMPSLLRASCIRNNMRIRVPSLPIKKETKKWLLHVGGLIGAELFRMFEVLHQPQFLNQLYRLFWRDSRR